MTEPLQQVAPALLQKPVSLKVDVRHYGVAGLLQKCGLLAKQKTFDIHPINFGTMIKISDVMVGIDMSIYDLNQILESNYQMLSRHGKSVAKIVAYAIVNRQQEPSERLVRTILNSFTSAELVGTLAIVLKQMDVTSFMKSIISMKGTNLLKMSPVDQGSAIAPGASLEEL